MKIFVSYAREDFAFAETLRNDLASLGHSVWIDQLLLGGQEWWDEILQHIRDCEVFVLAVSPNSIESEPCLLELRYADAVRRPFLPAMVLKTDPNYFPPEIMHAQYVDYTQSSKESLIALVASISAVPAPRELPDPLPPPPSMPQSPLYEVRRLIALSDELDRQRQLYLVDTLQRHYSNPKLKDDVLELKSQFRQRGDIMVDVLARLEQIGRIIIDNPPQPSTPLRRGTWKLVVALGLILIIVVAIDVNGLDRSVANWFEAAIDAAAATTIWALVLRKGKTFVGWKILGAGLIYDAIWAPIFNADLPESKTEFNRFMGQVVLYGVITAGLLCFRPLGDKQRSKTGRVASVIVTILAFLLATPTGGFHLLAILSALLPSLVLGAGVWVLREKDRNRFVRRVLGATGVLIYLYYVGLSSPNWDKWWVLPWAAAALLIATAATYSAERWPEAVEPLGESTPSSGPQPGIGSPSPRTVPGATA
jgi:hypothetical protein